MDFQCKRIFIQSKGQLDNLSLDGGIVVLADDIVWQTYENTIIKDSTGNEYVLSDYRNRDGKYSEVDISNLTGPGGIFKIDLDWQTNQGAKQYTEKSDFIKIGKAEDNSSQTVWFDISKAHLDEMKDGDKLYLRVLNPEIQPSLPMLMEKSAALTKSTVSNTALKAKNLTTSRTGS